MIRQQAMGNVGLWWTHVPSTGSAIAVARPVAEPVAATAKLVEATLRLTSDEPSA